MRARARETRPAGQDEANAKRCPACGSVYPSSYRACPKDGTSLEMQLGGDDDPLIGDVIAGTFCVVGVIGEGGMGRVYEAEHVRLPRRYAVKVLAPELARNQEAIGRFEREAQAVARIIHPNVVDVVDVVRTKDSRPCMVTELLVGEELGVLLDRVKKLPALEAVDICRQACRGLSAAHAQGIVHRDLKPSNLFLCESPAGRVVKVLDFGVAKMTDGASLTRAGTVVGTPAYMAPEQARGMPDVDGRADVYSIGAVLYHLITGHAPFEGDEPAQVLLAVATQSPRPPRQIDPSLPEMLELVVLGALAREPAERFASAAELESQLAAFTTDAERPSRASASQPGAGHSPTLVDPVAPPPAAPIAREPTPALGSAPFAPPQALLPTLAGVVLLGVLGFVTVLAADRKSMESARLLIAAVFAAVVGAAVAAIVLTQRRGR